MGIRQCPNCKTQYSDSVKFCTSCGALLEENFGDVNLNVSDISVIDNSEVHEWKFKTSFAGDGEKVTEVKTVGSQVSIEQYKRVIIKWGTQKDTLDVNDIMRIEQTKKISIGSIVFILFGIIVTVGMHRYLHPVLGIIIILFGLWGLYEKVIYIHHKHGRIKMLAHKHNSNSSDIEEFISFIRKYNPSAVKTFIE